MVEVVGRINDWKLFREAVHKLGKLFYTEDENGNIQDVIYCSREKGLKYVGPISQEIAKIIRAEGWKVDVLEFDEDRQLVKIVQGKGEES